MPDQNLWDSVVDAAKSILPNSIGFLANAILPGSGGMAAGLISGVLGCDETPQSILAGLQAATPEQIQQITTEANRHKEKLFDIGLEGDKLAMLDRQNARQRQTTSEKATGKRDINMYVMAYIFIGGIFAALFFLMIKELPDKNVASVNLLVGFLQTTVGMIAGYFFGTSKSSADKTSLMAAKK